MNKRSLVFVILLITINMSYGKVLKYNVIDLGTLSGYEDGWAWSINSSNKIVGYVYKDIYPMDFRAVLFDETGGQNNIDLGLLSGGSWSTATAINDSDEIVGHSDYELSLTSSAVLFDVNNPANNIMLCAYAATGINNIGQVIGVYSGIATLFGTDPTQNCVQLGQLSGYTQSEAYCINDKALIAGISCDEYFMGFDMSTHFRATMFDSTGNGNNIDLGTLGGMDSAALAMNNSGQIVGFAENENGTRLATLFSRTLAANINLGTVPGYDRSFAHHINNKGQIVGYAYNYSDQSCAVLFEPTDPNKNIDLNTLVDPGSGWHLDSATRINDNGYILCQGINQSGQYHPLLLVPAIECAEPLAGDLNDDCKVDFMDFAVMANNWQSATVGMPGYELIDLGILPGCNSSMAWSVNNSGKIVGFSQNWNVPGQPVSHAVLFDESGLGNIIDLGTLPDGTTASAVSINNNNQIVGGGDGPGFDAAAILFDITNSLNNLRLRGEQAIWTNNLGEIVGTIGNNAVLFSTDVAYDPVNLDKLSGYSTSRPYCINDNSWIVGDCYNNGNHVDDNWDGMATLFSTGGNLALGTLGGQSSIAVSVNNNNEIVGAAQDENRSVFATFFAPHTPVCNLNLGTVDGYGNSIALSINNNTQIVGYAYIVNFGWIEDSVAVLFDPTGQSNNINLNDLVDPAFGWQLTDAISINDKGWIVGSGDSPHGRSAYLLKPSPCNQPGDINGNCKVDLNDFAVIGQNWLGCNLVPESACLQ